MELTEEQKVLRGQLAETYLQDETLMGFISEMQQDILTCIGNTEPEHHQLRNTLYYQHKGLVDLLAHLTVYRVTAKAITERIDAEPQLDTD